VLIYSASLPRGLSRNTDLCTNAIFWYLLQLMRRLL